MPRYCVTVPLAGAMMITLDADDPKQAEEKALGASFRLVAEDIDEDILCDLGEFELLSHISQGNALYAPVNDIQVEED